MKFPAIALKIWLVFGFTLLLFSLAQSALLVYSFSSYTENQLITEMAGSTGTVIWSRSEGMKAEAVDRLEESWFPLELIDVILSQAEEQKEGEEIYNWESGEDRLLYSISRHDSGEDTVFSLAYIWRDLIDTRGYIYDGLHTSALLLLIILIPSYLISRNLVRPILRLREHAMKIASRDLGNPIRISRKDEIGELGRSLDQMRVQLREQDASQQRLFQAVSHELKTPVMVIRSYIQAIEDEVGPLDRNLDVIDREAVLLEQKIGKLISLAKIGYLTSHEKTEEREDISALAEEVIERFRHIRPELEWTVHAPRLEFPGNRDLLTVLFENIMDNQIRYAAAGISLRITSPAAQRILIEISNDGPRVEPENLERIFEIFHKGAGGVSGLGLAIVREICRHYGGDITAVNSENRTVFRIGLPTSGTSHNFP